MLPLRRSSKLRITPSSNRLFAYESSLLSLNEKDRDEHRDPEQKCFMCRQANVYIKPIGMHQERRVAQRHPPILTQAQIEELGKKTKLTRKEVRLLLRCYFPEIKNVQYFQLHKYHSCCYDPKHLDLCKNHITALQHERDHRSTHGFCKDETDEDHYKEYEKNDGYQNRVSFVRIKIEPTNGIPTRFLAPAALPESLADMLIKQVNRLENKKNLTAFDEPSLSMNETQNLSQITQASYNTYENQSSNYRNTANSYDATNRHGGNKTENENNNDDDSEHDLTDSDDDEEDDQLNIGPSGIQGYTGNFLGRSQIWHEKQTQTNYYKQSENEKSSKLVGTHNLIVEDVENLESLFINEEQEPKDNEPVRSVKKKKHKKARKSRRRQHEKPKLNHWEILALDQANRNACGCRHHVRRLEANRIVYDWCRCKDHQHKEIKDKYRSTFAIGKQAPITTFPKLKKVETSPLTTNPTESSTAEFALAYDPTTIDYDVIQEAVYYRTSSGRLVKPEITSTFAYDDTTSSTGLDRPQLLRNDSKLLHITVKNQYQASRTIGQDHQSNRESTVSSISFTGRESLPYSKTSANSDVPSTASKTDKGIRIHKAMFLQTIPTDTLVENNHSENKSSSRASPKTVSEKETDCPPSSPMTNISQEKIPKHIYTNKRPTPNYSYHSDVLDDRRWFDQPLGDRDLLAVHDGRYGLIAGTSPHEYELNSRFLDNDCAELPLPTKSTIEENENYPSTKTQQKTLWSKHFTDLPTRVSTQNGAQNITIRSSTLD